MERYLFASKPAAKPAANPQRQMHLSASPELELDKTSRLWIGGAIAPGIVHKANFGLGQVAVLGRKMRQYVTNRVAFVYYGS